MTTSDAYYEWLLSDHPRAREERRRRRAENRALGLDERAQVQAAVAKVKANPEALHDVRRLAEIAERQLADRAAREDIDDAFSDDLLVTVERERLETTRRVSGDDPGYRYPARYLGSGAACQPVPTEPPRAAATAGSHDRLLDERCRGQGRSSARNSSSAVTLGPSFSYADGVWRSSRPGYSARPGLLTGGRAASKLSSRRTWHRCRGAGRGKTGSGNVRFA